MSQLAEISDIVARTLPPPRLGVALIGKEEEALVLDVIRRKEPFRYYGFDAENPPQMAATLERELAEMMGSRYALAVTSGTAALEIGMAALGIGAGDEVIIPVWSWDSCFTSVVRVGALPVLAEIDDTLCLAPGEISRLCTPRTKAVMVVHYQGVAADMDSILAEAKKAGIAVIEDCAESPGVTIGGRRVGSMGDIGVFSFQYAKSMSSGEGGALVMNDPVLYERSVRMHDLGKYRGYHENVVPPTQPVLCGGQYRMGELNAAVALAQLRKLDGLRSRCRHTQSIIMNMIHDLPGLTMRRIPDPSGDTGFEIYFWLDTSELAMRFVEELQRWNINAAKVTGTNCHYRLGYCRPGSSHAEQMSPLSQLPEWPAKGYRKEDFPITESLVSRFVAIPIGVLYSDEDAAYIGEAVQTVHRELSEEGLM